jgi:hypothetical protein
MRCRFPAAAVAARTGRQLRVELPGGPPDFDVDGTVGINDFLELLANWDDCP